MNDAIQVDPWLKLKSFFALGWVGISSQILWYSFCFVWSFLPLRLNISLVASSKSVALITGQDWHASDCCQKELTHVRNPSRLGTCRSCSRWLVRIWNPDFKAPDFNYKRPKSARQQGTNTLRSCCASAESGFAFYLLEALIACSLRKCRGSIRMPEAFLDQLWLIWLFWGRGLVVIKVGKPEYV